jgi:heme/copper-type cytochrome/quinol oxidase subunit 2
MKRFKLLLSAAALAWLASPTSLLACAACFGKSDAAMARSLNAGIFSLMAVVGTVLVGAASFFVFLSRKAAANSRAESSQPLPGQPHS